MVSRFLRGVRAACVASVLLSGTHAAVSHAAGAAVVIVHPTNPTTDLSVLDVQRLFRGDRRFWSRTATVTLVFCKTDTPELASFRDLVYGKQKDAFRSYWLQRVFRGESTAPTLLETYEAVAQYVAAHPGAAACVPADRAGAGVKVVTVGGLSSDASKYALK